MHTLNSTSCMRAGGAVGCAWLTFRGPRPATGLRVCVQVARCVGRRAASYSLSSSNEVNSLSLLSLSPSNSFSSSVSLSSCSTVAAVAKPVFLRFVAVGGWVINLRFPRKRDADTVFLVVEPRRRDHGPIVLVCASGRLRARLTVKHRRRVPAERRSPDGRS
jgi:hypothetical protein